MLKDLLFRLDLFDGSGAGAAGAAGAPGAGAEGSAGPGEADQAAPAKVIYGKQPAQDPEPEQKEAAEAPADAGREKTLEERTKAYKDLIGTEYKDIHTQEMQKIFDKRFKDYKELQSKVDTQSEVLQRLMDRYHITDGNLESLELAIDNDDSIWADAADEAGMTVDQYRDFKRLERENARLLQAEQARERQQRADAQVAKWTQEANDLKAQYPDFDLNAELANPDFGRLLQAGVPMDHAYKVAHFDEIQSAVASAVTKQTEKKVTDSVRAKGSRPIENGSTSQSGFIVKSDVSKLTKADRAEIARRAARGEQISF